MSITFEKAMDYSSLPKMYKEIADKYLLGKRFDSISEAFDQMRSNHSVEDHGFCIGEIVAFTPNNLPHIINQVTINVNVPADPGWGSPYSTRSIIEIRGPRLIKGLIAKVEE